MTRYGCDHCGDTYDEDNLEECAMCQADTCWKCAIVAELPELAPGNWWCDWCLKEVNRADLLKGKRYLEPTRAEREVAVARILTAGGYTLAAELVWRASESENERLTEALGIMGLDLEGDSLDFETSPERMSKKSGSLMLTERGYERLRSAILAALS